ncbi:phage Gp37/Gp68 family protein [Nocardia asiatica]|uniref:phage Gp37/Gp68 family protein n=1 Tax=Nocardia asiatica TaxID=209252 RepID=UPI00245539DF|nr:phage Gp37/Gp68 family protein [Nocardia asiatica]
MGNTSIEWTDKTWNPVTGCDKVSPGCDHCYAEGIANRFAGTPQFPNGFGVTLRAERLGDPLKWRKPARVFVNSMSDLFHDDVPDKFIAKVFGVMAHADQHTFQVLTKRPGRMRSLLRSDAFRELVFKSVDIELPDVMGDDWPLHNVWLGVSAEDQKWANIRIPALLDTPAAIRFVSAEPLLGPIDLGMWLEDDPEKFDVPPLDWVIVGGESGRKARPMHPDWARNLRNQCEKAGVAFHFKQHGEWIGGHKHGDPWAWAEPHAWVSFETGATATEDEALKAGGSWQAMWKVGKKAAGRVLDGRTWDAYPAGVAA